MYLVLGLGNPGREFIGTRHNLGYEVIEELARLHGIRIAKNQGQALVGQAEIAGHKVVLAEPQTYMNLSGRSATELLHWYKIPHQKMIVVFDDVDLDIGALRLREKGNSGGHKGVESVIAMVGATDFIRVRIGIGRESLTADTAQYVLAKVPPEQQPPLNLAVKRAADAVEAIVAEGIQSAMNKFNLPPAA